MVDNIYGLQVADPYRWLENGHSNDVKGWVALQDQYTESYLNKIPTRAALRREMNSFLNVPDYRSIERGGDYLFIELRDPGEQRTKIVARNARTAESRVLVDPGAWASKRSIRRFSPSPDGKWLAFTTSENNSDRAVLDVLDVRTGIISRTDSISDAHYAIPSWAPDGSGFFYTWAPIDDSIPNADIPAHLEVRYHRIGVSADRDEVIRPARGDTDIEENVRISADGHWLIATAEIGYTSDDVWFKSAVDRNAPWQPLAVGTSANYHVTGYGERLYVVTNADAPNGQVFQVDPRKPQREFWKNIIPERKDGVLKFLRVVGDRLAVRWWTGGRLTLELLGLDGAGAREVRIPGDGNIFGPVGVPGSNDAFIRYQSYATPPEIHSLRVDTGETRLVAKPDLTLDSNAYVMEKEEYTSPDGTRAPIFIVYRRDLRRVGNAPTILTGYGGFGESVGPRYIRGIRAWLDRGGVFAEAVLRGGSEFGEAWHRAGMLTHKQNVFDDFAAAARHLIQARWTTPARLAAKGESNGGLLVGASLVQHPELFRVAIMRVPLLDMLRFQLFGGGKTWTSEYGTIAKRDEFQALFGYSPYHNVRPCTGYPSVFVLSADADDRVDAMHARKFVAELQDMSDGGRVVLRTQKHTGHMGASDAETFLQDEADIYAFTLHEMGIDE